MQEGLSGYRIDVPDGEYEVDLLFAETKFETAGSRVFDVKANGELIIESLDLAKEVGRNRIFSKRQRIKAVNGLVIEFGLHVGEPILSGIRISRLQ